MLRSLQQNLFLSLFHLKMETVLKEEIPSLTLLLYSGLFKKAQQNRLPFRYKPVILTIISYEIPAVLRNGCELEPCRTQSPSCVRPFLSEARHVYGCYIRFMRFLYVCGKMHKFCVRVQIAVFAFSLIAERTVRCTVWCTVREPARCFAERSGHALVCSL